MCGDLARSAASSSCCPICLPRRPPCWTWAAASGSTCSALASTGRTAARTCATAWTWSQSSASGLPVARARGEALPFGEATFGVVLLHEVLEHFQDDAAGLAEALRVTRPGGRVFVFVPNRLYPFETHGVYLGKRYIFGNIPLVGYLPEVLRRRLVPHVRAYTAGQLRRLLAPLQCRIVVHVQIYPGYDKISRRWPLLARVVRRLTYLAEHTPLRAFGLSHFLVLEKSSTQYAICIT